MCKKQLIWCFVWLMSHTTFWFIGLTIKFTTKLWTRGGSRLWPFLLLCNAEWEISKQDNKLLPNITAGMLVARNNHGVGSTSSLSMSMAAFLLNGLAEEQGIASCFHKLLARYIEFLKPLCSLIHSSVMKRCTSIYSGHDEKTEDLGYPFYCHKQQSMIAILNENFKFFNQCALFTNEEEILAIKMSTTPSLKNRLKNQTSRLSTL